MSEKNQLNNEELEKVNGGASPDALPEGEYGECITWFNRSMYFGKEIFVIWDKHPKSWIRGKFIGDSHDNRWNEDYYEILPIEGKNYSDWYDHKGRPISVNFGQRYIYLKPGYITVYEKL